MNYKKKYKALQEEVRIFVTMTKGLSQQQWEKQETFKLLASEDFFKEMEKHTFVPTHI